MNMQSPHPTRFYARSYAYLCFAMALAALVLAGVIVALADSTGFRIAAVAVLLVAVVLLTLFGLSNLRNPYVEVSTDQVAIRALWSRRSYDLSTIDRVERHGFEVSLYGGSSDRPVVRVPSLILGNGAADLEAALNHSIRHDSDGSQTA